MWWGVIRGSLILASSAAIYLIVKELFRPYRSGVTWGELSLIAAVALNWFYLVFRRPLVDFPLSRVARLLSLWLSAKEAELKRKAGA